MSEYIKYPFYADDVPIDVSFLFKDEKPAGKHGFLQTKNKDFFFEDGTKARFWGCNFNGGSIFPSHDYSKKLSKRLSKIGINIVRFHQLDAEWNTPNIFSFTKGPMIKNTLHFDPDSMDRLDFFFKCLKDEGIYVYMDLLTYRRFKTGDGVENASQLNDAAKPYCLFNKKMIELQKKYARDLFCHVNKYTGIAYKDDPAVVMTEIVNETDLFSGKIILEPYKSEFKAMFIQWLEKNNINYDVENCDLDGMDDILVMFKMHIHDEYYKEMYDYLRTIGVRIPITGTNWTKHAGLFASNEKLDFTDSHAYFYDWKWGESEKYCMNKAITQAEDCGFFRLSQMRSFDKPFFVSEWDVPWPNEYRAESPILWAAVGAMQGWAGFAIHTYAYLPSQENMKIIGKELSSDAIGGVPYREGVFSTWNDPAKFGLFYHAAIITRRGDIKKANKKIGILVNPFNSLSQMNISKNATEMERYNASNCAVMTPAFKGATEQALVGACLSEQDEVDTLVNVPQSPVDLESREIKSDTGELYRNWEKNYGTIDSDYTKCIYGFLKKNGKISLEDLQVECSTDFAVIAASSLSDNPINNSENILITAVGRAKNTGAEFDGDKMVQWGNEPVLIETISADIKIKTRRSGLKVWSVTPEGLYHGVIPSTYENGILSFSIGKNWKSMYYILTEE